MARRFDFKRLAFIPQKNVYRRLTGNESIDRAVQAAAGRATGLMKAYEEFIGISDVKTAQNKVTEIEQQFLEARRHVMDAAQEVSGVQSDLRSIRGKLDRTARDDPTFLELATEEHRMLQTETRLKEWFASVEAKERESFDALSAAVRESHEEQRAQQERTKYWSVIGSVVGTIIGILGSTLVNHKRMKEIRTLVSDLSIGDLGSDSARRELSNILNQMRDSLGQIQGGSQLKNLENVLDDALRQQNEHLKQQLDSLEKLINERNGKLSDQIRGMRHVVVGTGDAGMLEELLSDTEQKLEWEMKMSTLSTVVFIYGAFALTLPILYSIFK